jgi:hypothetical protein
MIIIVTFRPNGHPKFDQAFGTGSLCITSGKSVHFFLIDSIFYTLSLFNFILVVRTYIHISVYRVLWNDENEKKNVIN